MKIVLQNSIKLESIKERLGFFNTTKTIKYLVSNYEVLLQENNKLTNENMVLQLQLKMLKNN